MSNAATWAPMYWAEYLLDTAHLSLAEHGAYFMVLARYYQAGKAPEANFDKLAHSIHAQSDAERLALRSVLKQFFKIKDGRYTNKRAEHELAQRHARSAAARLSAKVRWRR